MFNEEQICNDNLELTNDPRERHDGNKVRDRWLDMFSYLA